MLVPTHLVSMSVGLGAGDWRKSDDDFVEGFHAQPSRCDALRRRNPFPREDRIHFHEPSHTYTIDKKFIAPRSVTGFVHRYSNAFDPMLVIQQMQARPSWEWKQQAYLRSDGSVMTPKEIEGMWARNGAAQRNRGTLLHLHCEAFLNFFAIQGPPSPEFCQVSLCFFLGSGGMVCLCSSGFSTPRPRMDKKITSGCGSTKNSLQRPPPCCALS